MVVTFTDHCHCIDGGGDDDGEYGPSNDYHTKGMTYRHLGNTTCFDRVSKSKLLRRMTNNDEEKKHDDLFEDNEEIERQRSNKTCVVMVLTLFFVGVVCYNNNQGGAFPMFERFLPRSLSLTPIRLAWHAPPLKRREPIMALGIFSDASKASMDYRKVLRETFLSEPGVCTLTSYSQQQETINGNTNDIAGNKNCTLVYTFVLSQHVKNDLDMLLQAEDILFLDYKSSREYFELEKSKRWLSYISQKYLESGSIDYVAKINQETLIDTPQLVEFVSHDLDPAPYNRRIYGGVREDHTSCLEKVGVGSSDISAICDSIKGMYYMSEQFYWVSIDLAEYVTSPEAHKNMQHSWGIEGVDLSRYISTHPMPVKGIGIPAHWVLRQSGATTTTSTITATPLNPADIQRCWWYQITKTPQNNAACKF